jgi:hypothetical protein
VTTTKIASMTPPVPRGKIIVKRVGAQPVDEVDHFHQCEASVDFRKSYVSRKRIASCI